MANYQLGRLLPMSRYRQGPLEMGMASETAVPTLNGYYISNFTLLLRSSPWAYILAREYLGTWPNTSHTL